MRSDRPLSQKTPASVILDEAQHVAEAAPDLLSEIITEGRRFGLSLTVSHQSPAQIEDRKLKGVLRNVVGTTICFALGGGDADAMAGELPSEDPKPILRNLLISQKVGECLVSRQGQPLIRIRTRYEPDPTVAAPDIAALRAASLAFWGKPRAQVETDLDAMERRYLAPPAPVVATPAASQGTVLVRDADDSPVPPRRKKGGTP